MSVSFTFATTGTNPIAAAAVGEDAAFDDTIVPAGFHNLLVAQSPSLSAHLRWAVRAAARHPSLGIIAHHQIGALAPIQAADLIARACAHIGERLSLRLSVSDASASQAQGRTDGYVAEWRRADEYITLLKRLWTNDAPFDHEGPFYSIRSGFIPAKLIRKSGPEIRISGLSGTALQVVGKHANVYELPVGTLHEIRTLIDRVRSAADQFGRSSKIAFAAPLDAQAAQLGANLQPYLDLGVTEFLLGHEAAQADANARVGTEVRRPPLAENAWWTTL